MAMTGFEKKMLDMMEKQNKTLTEMLYVLDQIEGHLKSEDGTGVGDTAALLQEGLTPMDYGDIPFQRVLRKIMDS